MVTKTPEVRSAAVNVTKDLILHLIIADQVLPLFLRPHLNLKYYWAFLLGTIGDRGGGKSATDAVIAIIDHMIRGETVYSNMSISCEIEIDDETAREYGLNSGGIVSYHSKELDKDALLQLDERYRKSCLVIEEINVQYSNVRRFMSNTNVDFNEVCQQLRHLETSLLYNVIDEMFIDPQLRSLTDVFIRTYDTAFEQASLINHKPRGEDFMWRIYPMTGYLCGEEGKYSRTGKTVDGVHFHYKQWQGCYDTIRHQTQGLYSMSTKEKKKRLQGEISVESSPETIAYYERWAWLIEKIQGWKKAGIKKLAPWQLKMDIGQPVTQEMRDEVFGPHGVYYDNGVQSYVIGDFSFDRRGGGGNN